MKTINTGWMGLGRVLVAAVALLVAVGAVPALAAPGDLDPAFSGDGRLVAGFDSFSDLEPGANAIAIQPNGKIVVAGGAYDWSEDVSYLLVARFDADGTFDATFSGDGWLTDSFSGLTSVSASGVVVQPDGKIVVGGAGGKSFAFARYDAGGALDASFGVGGHATYPLGHDPVAVDRDLAASFADLALQPDGGLVAAGTAMIWDLGDLTGQSDVHRTALMRLQPSGDLDGSFGTGGLATGDVEGDRGGEVALQPDGKIAVAGSRYDAGLAYERGTVLLRYTPAGALDASFGAGGRVQTDAGSGAVALQPDGRILVAGGRDGAFEVSRYGASGAFDTSFSGDGSVTTDLGEAATATAVVAEPDGRIVTAGWASDGDGGSSFALTRHGANGALDVSFSGDGRVTTSFGDGTAWAVDGALQADGRLVLAGNFDYALALARYELGGQPAPDTGGGGSGGGGGGGAGSGGGGGSGGEPVRRDTSGRTGPAVKAACSKARTARSQAQRQLRQARRKLSAAKRPVAKRKAKRTVKRRRQALSKATKQAKRVCG